MSTVKRRSRRIAERHVDSSSDCQVSQRASINSLTPELLMKIFHYLPHKQRLRMESVSKHWRQWSQETWKTMEGLFVSAATQTTYLITVNHNWIELYTQDTAVLKKVLSLCGKNLSFLKIQCDVEIMMNNSFHLIMNYCRSLRELHVGRVERSGRKLGTLFVRNPQLKSLRLGVYHDKLIHLEHLPDGLEELEIISILYWTDIQRFTSIIGSLPALRSLKTPIDVNVLRTIGGFTNLTSLSIVSIAYCDGETIRELFNITKLHNLEHLNVNSIGQIISDEFLIELSQNCKKIKQLFIAAFFVGPESVTREGLTALTVLPELEMLDLIGRETMCDEILLELQTLQRLRISKCAGLTDRGVISFIERNEKLKEFKIHHFGRSEIHNILTASTAIINQRGGNQAPTLKVHCY